MKKGLDFEIMIVLVFFVLTNPGVFVFIIFFTSVYKIGTLFKEFNLLVYNLHNSAPF
jgi:hypothetical protein